MVVVLVEDDLAVDDPALPIGDDLLEVVVDRQERLVDVLDDAASLLALAGIQLADPRPSGIRDLVARLGDGDQTFRLEPLERRRRVDAERRLDDLARRPALDVQHLQHLIWLPFPVQLSPLPSRPGGSGCCATALDGGPPAPCA